MATLAQLDGKDVVPLLINSKNQPVSSSSLLEIVQARGDKVVHYAQSADEASAKAAVEAAQIAFESWSKSALTQRREILLRAADLLTERAEEIATMQALETSSLVALGALVTTTGANIVREIASQITVAYSGTLPHSDHDDMAFLETQEAIGPILLIFPWNAPTFQGPRGISAAVAAGCTIVLKASELCPQTYRLICQTFIDAGLPDGVLNQIVVRRDDASKITEIIISDPRIRKVNFIGSSAIGSLIGQLCGKYLKPSFMELGGKCPVIICKDANLENAAEAICSGAFLLHGQLCLSTERIIVVKEAAEELSRHLKTETNNWAEQGGSAAAKRFSDKTHRLAKEAVDQGAEILAGDNAVSGEHGTALRPTILTNVSRDAELFHAESFGPSASLYVVNDEDEALQLANDTSYGLAGSVWSNDILRALSLSKRLQCGTVQVNGATIEPGMPAHVSTQALKGSGWGTANGASGIREFLITKTIILRSGTS